MVVASDGGGLETAVEVQVALSNVNDNVPAFLSDLYVAAITEDAVSGTAVATVSAFDADLGEFGVVAYSIEQDSDGVHFSVDANGRVTVLASNAFDFEAKQTYTVTVIARDIGLLEAQTTVAISTLDVNDNTPTFAQSTYARTVSESETPGFLVAMVHAHDVDSEANSAVTYEIVGGNAMDHFVIDPVSGEIMIALPIDFMLSSTATVDVTVLDANDSTPVFAPESLVGRVTENLPANTRVLQVQASDADTNAGGNVVRFAIATPNVPFVINDKTGEVRTTRPRPRGRAQPSDQGAGL